MCIFVQYGGGMTNEKHDLWQLFKHPFRDLPRLWWFAVGVVLATTIADRFPSAWPEWVGAIIAMPFLLVATWRDRRHRDAERLGPLRQSVSDSTVGGSVHE